jgi:hypothetical protein
VKSAVKETCYLPGSKPVRFDFHIFSIAVLRIMPNAEIYLCILPDMITGTQMGQFKLSFTVKSSRKEDVGSKYPVPRTPRWLLYHLYVFTRNLPVSSYREDLNTIAIHCNHSKLL